MAFSKNILGFSQSISAFSVNASFITHVPSINIKPSSPLPQEGSWKTQTKRAYARGGQRSCDTLSLLWYPEGVWDSSRLPELWGVQSHFERTPWGSAWWSLLMYSNNSAFSNSCGPQTPLELRLSCQFEWVSQGLQSLVLRAAVFLQVLS